MTLQVKGQDGEDAEVRVRLGEHPDQDGVPYLGVAYAVTMESELELERFLPEGRRWGCPLKAKTGSTAQRFPGKSGGVSRGRGCASA